MTQQQQSLQDQSRTKKVDISSKIAGKVQDQKIIFYVGDRNIGTMDLPADHTAFELEEGFGVEEGKIYQKQTEGVQDDQYVEGCDMGWC